MSKVVIIGGGIAGLSAAAALASDGFEVCLFEAEPHLGYHASGRSAAVFVENYGNATVRRLNGATQPILASLGVLSPRGILLVAREQEVKDFKTTVVDMEMQKIALSDARALVPILSDQVAFAAFQDDALDIDTDALLQAFARTARTHGAKIETNARVQAISPGVGVKVDGTHVTAEFVVNAAGAWADEVAALAGARPIGLQPLRRSMARLPAPDGFDVRLWPMLLGAGESWYAKPDAGSWMVSPAEEHLVKPMDAWADDLVLAEGLARYEAHVSVPVSRIQANWAGLRTFAPDRTLVIGEDPLVTNFYWLSGQGGYGFQTCVAAADHLSDLMSNRTPRLGQKIADDLSPTRLN